MDTPALIPSTASTWYTDLYNGADTAYPARAPIPTGTKIACLYLDGPDAERATPVNEWNDAVDQMGPGGRLLPIWVDDKSHYLNGAISAQQAVTNARDLGWAIMRGTSRRWIVLDVEGSTDYNYAAEFMAETYALGFRALIYRDLASFTPQFCSPSTTWLAIPGQPKPTRQIWAGYQYLWGEFWDQSTFASFIYQGCGEGNRK